MYGVLESKKELIIKAPVSPWALPPVEGLLAYYGFEEEVVVNGQTYNSLANQYHGSFAGAKNEIGKIKGGYSFNHGGGLINLGSNPFTLLADSTISFWANPISDGTHYIAFQNGDYNKWGAINFRYSNGQNYPWLYYGLDTSSTGFGYFQSPEPSPAGKWTHWALTRNHTTKKYRFHRNAVIVAEHTTANNAADTTTGSMYLGGGYAGTFKGTLDEFAFYNRELSSEEIAQIYNKGEGTTLLKQW